MSVLATIALAASAATLPQCSWDKPGANPFMGDVVAAVDRYTDIAAPLRAKLKARMQARQYDEIVSITRDAIQGQAQYGSEIRDMHFGAGSVCSTVTRAKWTDKAQERGLVYCEDGQCILVPTICRNVSRITRIAPKPAPKVAQVIEPQTELELDPPGAGVPAGGAPAAAAAPSPSFAQLASPQPTTSLSAVPGPTPGRPVQPAVFPPGLPALPPGIPGATPPIPEPETWALLLAGLATVAWVLRRRQPS